MFFPEWDLALEDSDGRGEAGCGDHGRVVVGCGVGVHCGWRWVGVGRVLKLA